ncbi:MAG TPA: hypothetical protein PKX00_22515 [Opitutaceae bacterium]|jgi:hypothetical protein|nr:hypothetical protein [Opitutaceae bacterium]
MARPRSHPFPLLTRLTAVLGTWLVLVLSVLAVDPALHAWIHGEAGEIEAHTHCAHAQAHDHHSTDGAGSHDPHSPAPTHSHGEDEACIVSQFSHGGSDQVVAPNLLPWLSLARTGDLPALCPACAPGAPDHLLPPGCGPPAV